MKKLKGKRKNREERGHTRNQMMRVSPGDDGIKDVGNRLACSALYFFP
jgi:hypothetical protein